MAKKVKRGSAIIAMAAALTAFALGLAGAGRHHADAHSLRSAASWYEQDASWGDG